MSSPKNAVKKSDKFSHEQINSLKTFLSSFYFLAEEAERDGFPDIHMFLKEGIYFIDCMLQAKGQKESYEVIDDSLFRAMRFLSQISQITDTSRREFVDMFETLQEIFQSRKSSVGKTH